MVCSLSNRSIFKSKRPAEDTHLRTLFLMDLHIDQNLALIFAFVIILTLIRRGFHMYQTKLWHDASRAAIDKGLPPPPAPSSDYGWQGRCGNGRGSGWWELRRGLVMVAVGGALYLALPPHAKLYALIPGFIGIASLIFAAFSLGRPSKFDSDRDPSSPNKLP